MTKLELDRIEEDKAILFTDNHEEIILPKKMLPRGAQEGDVVTISVNTDRGNSEEQEKNAKELLNEILNIQP